MKNMTKRQLIKVMNKYKYILLRHYKENILIGHNCSIVNLAKFKKQDGLNEETNWIGFRPCNFQEYISNKIRF